MKQIRLSLIVLLLPALCACMLVGCNGKQTTDTTTADNNGTVQSTEAPTEAPTDAPAPKVDVTLTVKDQDGNPVSEAVLTILPDSGEGESATLTANEEGSVTVSLPEGEYTVRFDILPEYVLGIDTKITVVAGMEPVALEVTDNTPNGTEERPFVVSENSITVKIPAGETHHFTLFGANNRTLTYTNGDVIVLYKDGVYHPDSNGLMELRMSTDSPREHSFFALQNTGAAEVEMTVEILSDPGAMDNPIVIETLGEAITANVPQDDMLYYTWTATATGTLTVTSADATNNISINNLTTSQVSDFSAGSESISLSVTEGDVITIVVSVIGGDLQAEFNAVHFTVVME